MNIHERRQQLVVERVPNFNPQTTQLAQERGYRLSPLFFFLLLLVLLLRASLPPLKHSLSPHLHSQFLSARLLLPFFFPFLSPPPKEATNQVDLSTSCGSPCWEYWLIQLDSSGTSEAALGEISCLGWQFGVFILSRLVTEEPNVAQDF